jgi:hypothetical protein
MIATSAATSKNCAQKKKKKQNKKSLSPTLSYLKKKSLPGLLRDYFRVRVAVRHKGRRSRVKRPS